MPDDPTTLDSSPAGRYRLARRLGAGGMGEVWLAADSVLGRDVALKFLLPTSAADGDARSRFHREARTIAALNHPGIATVYDTGELDGRPYIAMEYLDGRTLRDHIAAGPLSREQVRTWAIQAASALDYAHRKGVLHRDLKPANAIVTTTGSLKLLDFGLAKVAAAGDETQTLLSVPGTFMGTLPYAAPELLQGQPASPSTDIYSLGVMLYELACGARPFQAESTQQLIAAILQAKPLPVQTRNPAADPALARIIERAMAPSPADRFAGAGELLRALQPDQSAAPSPAKSRWLWIGFAAAAVLTAGAVIFLNQRPSPATAQPELPLRKWAVGNRTGVESFPALSPDGTRLAFTWDGGNAFSPPALYIEDLPANNLPAGAPRLLPGSSEGAAVCPAWSPDGKSLVFVREGPSGSVVMMTSAGGTGERVVRELGSGWSAEDRCRASFTPDGRALAIAVSTADGPSSLVHRSLETGTEQPMAAVPSLVNGDYDPVYSPDGLYLAFVRADNRASTDVFLVPTRPDGTASGDVRPLTRGREPIHGIAWTADSQSIVYSATRRGVDALWRIPIGGGTPQQVSGGDNGSHPSLSRTGGKLAFAVLNENRTLWRLPLSADGLPSAAAVPLLPSTRKDEGPTFSRDGRMISFFSDRTGSYEVWTCGADGSNPRAITSFGGTFVGLSDWSPDGRTLVFDAVTSQAKHDVFTVPSAGGQPALLISNPGLDVVSTWSRDGKFIYFASDRSGRFQIWRAEATGANPVQITRGGGFSARESDDGYLYYADSLANPVVRRLRLTGGQEETLLDAQRPRFFGHWAHHRNWIYFIPRSESRFSQLWRHDITTGVARKIADLAAVIHQATPSLAISPDGRTIVYSRVEPGSGDLYLMEP